MKVMQRFFLTLFIVFVAHITMQAQQTSISYGDGVGGSVHATLASSPNTYVVTATPSSGYEFLFWADDQSIKDNPRRVEFSTRDTLIRAVFGKSSDLVGQGGHTEVLLVDNVRPTFALKAVSGTCGTFVRWTDGSTKNPLGYTEQDGTKIPQFSVPLLFQEHLDSVGGKIVVEPKTCGFTLTAVPNPGYKFAGWENGERTAKRDVDFIANTYTATFSKGAAKRDNILYPTIQDALNADGNGPVLVLLDDPTENLTISSDVTISGNMHQIGDLTIQNGSNLTLSNTLNVKDLYIQATTGSSSQLFNPSNLKYQNAYIDIRLEATKTNATKAKWYAMSVPFEVDVQDGVYRAGVAENAVNMYDYILWEYDGTLRAQTKDNGWVKMFDGKMQAGHFYMFGSMQDNQNVWRFRKTSNSPLEASNSIPLYQFPSDNRNRGWNAVGNSLLHYADASIDGVRFVQVYDNAAETGKYIIKMLNSSSFVVASPFFAQVKQDGMLYLQNASHNELYAPRRQTETEEIIVEVIVSKDANHDNMFVSTSPDATNDYEIGLDVMKLMGGENELYIWSNAYGYRLSAQDAPTINGVATFNVTVNAPTEGQYVFTTNGAESVFVDLFSDGKWLANIQQNSFPVQLNKGENQFELRMGKTIPSQLDDSPMTQHSNVRKVFYKNHIYIINNGHVYNTEGRLVQ